MSKSKSRIYLIIFTALLAVVSLSSFAVAEDATIATTENFDAAVAQTSGLVPATKPLNGRTAYTKTNYYVGLKKTADGLAEQVSKKYSYDSEKTTKVKTLLNDKLTKSLQSIKDRKTASRKKIEKETNDRLDVLYYAADDDATIGYTKVEDAYYAKLDQADADKASALRKAKASYQKSLKKLKKKAKKKSSSKKAARAKKARIKKAKSAAKRAYIQKKKEAINTYKTNLKAYDKELDDGLAIVDAAYEAQIEKADKIVAGERTAAIAALNTATDKEMTLRGTQKTRLTNYINKLSKSSTTIKLGATDESIKSDPDKPVGKSDKAKAKAKAKARAEAKKKAKYCAKPANKKKKTCKS